jgi:hypothetical protein
MGKQRKTKYRIFIKLHYSLKRTECQNPDPQCKYRIAGSHCLPFAEVAQSTSSKIPRQRSKRVDLSTRFHPIIGLMTQPGVWCAGGHHQVVRSTDAEALTPGSPAPPALFGRESLFAAFCYEVLRR